ncbi:unnamed protein product, partial [Polarella glacialis]
RRAPSRMRLSSGRRRQQQRHGWSLARGGLLSALGLGIAVVACGPAAASPQPFRQLISAGLLPGVAASIAPCVGAASEASAPLRIVAMSDTHGFHRSMKVPAGDILVHCGDVTMRERTEAVDDFCKWFADMPHRLKFIICGNHEKEEQL